MLSSWQRVTLLAATVVASSVVVAASPAPGAKNFFLIAVDDLRPMFGESFAYPEVLTPNMDAHFTNGGGSAMQHSYVQVAVCGPSRASILTGRRPDTTTVGVVANGPLSWCWCQRTKCQEDALFMTLPTYFAENGFVTSGTGKIFHPDGCTKMRGPFRSFGKDFAHTVGDDYRAWNDGAYGEEGRLQKPFDGFIDQFSEEQFGTIPGPNMATFNHTWGPSWMRSPLSDEEQTDGQLATDTIERLAKFSTAGIGKGDGKPFFLATGFHKPHTPWIVPEKYFDLYDIDKISLPPNPRVPAGFKEENWHANGNMEIEKYFSAWPNPDGSGSKPFDPSAFSFNKPVDNQTARELRLAYFAATSFVDAQIGRVMDALGEYGYMNNTVVALWSGEEKRSKSRPREGREEGKKEGREEERRCAVLLK
jgi:iduronate 2-sulfatase/deleted-in-malignant-brain-tumors protein 1